MLFHHNIFLLKEERSQLRDLVVLFPSLADRSRYDGVHHALQRIPEVPVARLPSLQVLEEALDLVRYDVGDLREDAARHVRDCAVS